MIRRLVERLEHLNESKALLMRKVDRGLWIGGDWSITRMRGYRTMFRIRNRRMTKSWYAPSMQAVGTILSKQSGRRIVLDKL